jgi:hypothetical protein
VKYQASDLRKRSKENGHEPAGVTKPWMTKYLLDQKAGRKGIEFCSAGRSLSYRLAF